MLRLTNFRVPLDYTEGTLRDMLEKKLGIGSDELISFSVYRRSVDARDKKDVHFVLSVDLTFRHESELKKKHRILSPVSEPSPMVFPARRFRFPPLIVGAGPSGLFAALVLAGAGAAPVLIERGSPVEKRQADVLRMTDSGLLNPESNIQFGEGGAGAFSDGKLTCGIKSPYLRFVLETFVRFGAPADILIDQKPHIGTDLLRKVISSIRDEIIRLGGTVLFETRMEEMLIHHGSVSGVRVSENGVLRDIRTDHVLLCIGHSARDTVQQLFTQGMHFTQKPFAMGVRIEHPRAMIDRVQYGAFAGHPALGPASYKLVCHTPDQRGVYTFCMCPGGYVIPAASQPSGVVVNGMSYHDRAAENSNSALLVGIHPADFGDDHPLAGFILQRSIEKSAYAAGGGGFKAPAQRVEDFLADRESARFGDVVPSYCPGVVPADLRAVLPDYICRNLKAGIRAMNSQLAGFSMPDAVLTGPETRSSSPVRMTRLHTGEAEGISGLYPAGEGAGYAGGIVSSAVDGITAAESLLRQAE